MSFLPVTRADMEERGWEQLDFLYVMWTIPVSVRLFCAVC